MFGVGGGVGRSAEGKTVVGEIGVDGHRDVDGLGFEGDEVVHGRLHKGSAAFVLLSVAKVRGVDKRASEHGGDAVVGVVGLEPRDKLVGVGIANEHGRRGGALLAFGAKGGQASRVFAGQGVGGFDVGAKFLEELDLVGEVF